MGQDEVDRRILRQLQRDCDISLDMLSLEIGLSRNACWRRIKHMQEAGFIRKRVALLDAPKLGLGLTVYIQVRAEKHAAGWSAAFARGTRSIPELRVSFVCRAIWITLFAPMSQIWQVTTGSIKR